MNTTMSKYVPHWMHYLLPVSALSTAPDLTEHILTPVPILPDQHLNGASLIKWVIIKRSLPVILVVFNLIIFVPVIFIMVMFVPIQVVTRITDMIFVSLLSYKVKLKVVMMNQSSKCAGKVLVENQALKRPALKKKKKWRRYYFSLLSN